MHTVFDAHLHIIDPRFPLIENQGFVPAMFTRQDYLSRMQNLNLQGGAVVSGSFQGFDQTYLIASLQELGPNFAGVAQLPHDTSDEELLRLHDSGVRAVRFNITRGGSAQLSRLDYFSRRVYEVAGWHTELYIDSAALPELAPVLTALPAVSIDHLGLSGKGFPQLLALADKGVKVKASGFGRVELDVQQALRAITAVNPDALMFGSDLPSTRAQRPYHPSDVELIYNTLGEKNAGKVLCHNALNWYFKQ